MRITHISWKDLVCMCMSVHIDTQAWFNKSFIDKKYNHCRRSSRTRAKRKRNKHALKKVCLNTGILQSSMAVVYSEFIGCFRVDQKESSQITDNQQINRIHYRKALISSLSMLCWIAVFSGKLTKSKKPDIPHLRQGPKNITGNVLKSLKPSGPVHSAWNLSINDGCLLMGGSDKLVNYKLTLCYMNTFPDN